MATYPRYDVSRGWHKPRSPFIYNQSCAFMVCTAFVGSICKGDAGVLSNTKGI